MQKIFFCIFYKKKNRENAKVPGNPSLKAVSKWLSAGPTEKHRGDKSILFCVQAELWVTFHSISYELLSGPNCQLDYPSFPGTPKESIFFRNFVTCELSEQQQLGSRDEGELNENPLRQSWIFGPLFLWPH